MPQKAFEVSGSHRGTRRLAAIMFTDMVGYTAIGQRDEPLALRLADEQRRVIRTVLGKYNGREIKTMGDSFLIEFSSALDAVRCAFDIQRRAREFNLMTPTEEKLSLRIGVHLGDVQESRGDISGDAVNIASRIQPLAEDGGVCITRQVYDQVQHKLEFPLSSVGTRSLKNVSTPVELFKVIFPWAEERIEAITDLDAKRLAVLPFANMSPDPNDSYFADGITEEIISTLSGVSGLSVISRTSVMGYKSSSKKAREIGKELEVGSILEGSFRKAGNKVRVTTQLIDVSNDQHIWAQSYDRNLDDVFAVQTDIAKQVSDALKVKILAPEIERIHRKPTENTTAYALYLRGRYLLDKRGIEDIKKAAEYFQKAVKEDPDFALGYVGLADSDELLAYNWGIETKARHERAKTTIAKALEIDQDLAEAHATRGLALLHDFDPLEAEKEFKKAIELKPNYATAHQWYFHLLAIRSRWDEALKQIEIALELDPLSQIINLNHAEYYFGRRDYPRSVELYKKAIELNPHNDFAHFELARVYGWMGMKDEMKREVKTLVGLVQESYPQVVKTANAIVAYFEHDGDTLRRLLPELEAKAGELWTPDMFEIAGYHFDLGEKDKGFEWLEKSFSRREFLLYYIKDNQMFDGIRGDGRYQNLLHRLGVA